MGSAGTAAAAAFSLQLLLCWHVMQAAPIPGAAAALAPEAPVSKTKQPVQPVCGAEPKHLQGFDRAATACWADAALPPAALRYPPISTTGAQRVAAGSWSDLQRAVKDARGPIQVTLSGSLTADTPLVISSKASTVQVSGPADIACSSVEGSSAFVIQRSAAVILQDLAISGCTGTAISINATAAANVPSPITAAARGRTTAAPNVVLKNVAISDCSGGKGAGVSATSSRVVLEGCRLSSNTADGCGAGVFADRSALLVLDSKFTNNEGSSNAADFEDECRGGAIHAQRSWLGITRSSFVENRGANGSAVLILQPVGIAQLQDCAFESNQPRPGTSADFPSSGGAVGLVGTGVEHVLERGMSNCMPMPYGLAVARCTFSNNTAAVSGGRGGSITVNDAYLAVINTTFFGSEVDDTRVSDGTPGSEAAAKRMGRGGMPSVREMALNGGCMALDTGTLYVTGSSFNHCNAHMFGGGISMRGVDSVILDTVVDNSFADQGGGIRITSGNHLLSNVSIRNCHALNSGAGLYIEPFDETDVHIQGCTLDGNALTGRGGAVYTDFSTAAFKLSMHDSRITRNTASFGAGLAILTTSVTDLRNNFIAHNTAFQAGGGLWCSNKAENTSGSVYGLTNNTWLNNTALIRGGGIITNPCNMTVHNDKLLGNRALQEGGGFMVYGGETVVLQSVQVSCNSARQGGGVAIQQSEEGVASAASFKCSSITANGVMPDATAQQACLQDLAAAAAVAKPGSDAFLFAAAAAASSQSSSGQAFSTEIGGGMWVARGQEATLISSIVGGNHALRSGAGIYLDKDAYLELDSSDAGPAAVSYNNCTAGSGGALFMNNASQLFAIEATLNNNRGTFGGAVFAMGDATYLELEAVSISNNTAAAGGAVATLGGSTVNCTADCTFNFNQAKTGGALMLHQGSNMLVGATLQGNIAASATGTAAALAAATIYYKLGEIPTSAGGAVYAWMGSLQLAECTVADNVAWGANGRGGAVFAHGTSLQLSKSTFDANFASAAGGAVLLGPSGPQVLQVTGSRFSGNAARQYGGALAAGLLLPGDAAVANAQAMQGEPPSSWRLQLSKTQFANNTAGMQGGALACSVCDSISITGSSFENNAAMQAGGGISCLSCTTYVTNNCSFQGNLAASGAGACILAAGNGSASSGSVFLSNVAGHGATIDASARLQAAAAAASGVAASHTGMPAANMAAFAAGSPSPMLSPRDTLPACGIIGTGGGMCLGLWDAGFRLVGTNKFVNNSALFGAGLFIEACPKGAEVCPVGVNPRMLVFKGNTLSDGGAASAGISQRRMLQAQGGAGVDAASLPGSAASDGSGADVYATNATVLVRGSSVLPPAAAAVPAKPAATAAKPAVSGRHLLQKTASTTKGQPQNGRLPQANALAVAQQLASAAAVVSKRDSGANSQLQPQAQASRVATGPSQLGPVQLVNGGPGSDYRQLTQDLVATVAVGGNTGGIRLNVLDQLGSQVSSNVAEQLSVIAELDNCTMCMVAGINKVQPSGGTAVFDSIQLLAPPGTNQSMVFTLLNTTGAKLGDVQRVKVRLPACRWGQARQSDGCHSCTYPLFTFSNPQRSNCSICPSNARNCSGTMLLPDMGYWQSGPLSAHMIKCPRNKACRRDGKAYKKLACLQQQQLILNNPGYTDNIGSAVQGKRSSRSPTPWDTLQEECKPLLQQMVVDMSQVDGRPGKKVPALIDQVLLGNGRHLLQGTMIMQYPGLNTSDAIANAYAATLCAEGHMGRLCDQCLFPGNERTGAWGTTFSGACGKCPSRSFSTASYLLSRLFDFAIVGLLIITALVEMKKRRTQVEKARQAMVAKLAGKGGSGGGGTTISIAMPAPAPAAPAPAGGAGDVAVDDAMDAPSIKSQAAIIGSFGSRDREGAASTLTDSMQQRDNDERVSAWAAGLMSPGDPGVTMAAQQPEASPSFALQPVSPPVEQSTSFSFVQQQQQQQQQHMQHAAAVHEARSDITTSTTSSMQRSQVALMHGHAPSAAAGGGTAGRPPRELNPGGIGSHVSPAGGDPGQAFAAAAALSPAQGVNETMPGAGAGAGAVVEAGVPGPAAAGVSGNAAPVVDLWALHPRLQKPLQRVPLFAREVTDTGTGQGTTKHVASYTPASLKMGELFEVLKDFMQVLAILQTVLLSWQTAAAAVTAVTSAVNPTPQSTQAWISLDCLLPRTLTAAQQRLFYRIAAQLLLPLLYALIVLLVFLVFAAHASLRWRQHFWRDVLGLRLKAPIISSFLVLVSYFYPSWAYTILSVFSCRYLDPSSGTSVIDGEELRARGWYWASDLERQCFVDPTHRALVLGLGIPGTLLLVAYPLLQACVLARQVAAGRVTSTSEFFASYGHLVEDFRPRLFFWGSVVELRKLLLVAVVLGLDSMGIVSQLMGCGLVLLAYCTTMMGLLPYPYRMLNRLHLGSGGVLLVVVWINLFIASGRDSDALSAATVGRRSMGLQLLSVILVLGMVAVLLGLFGFRLYEQAMAVLDVDKDGKISRADINALLQSLLDKGGIVAKVLACLMPRTRGTVLRSSKGSTMAAP